MPKPRKKPASKPVAKVTPKKRGGEWHERFLALFALSLNVGLSAQGAGVDRRQVYRERERNAEFAAQNLNRKCYAIEISPDYCAVILERMSTAFPDLEIKRDK